MKQQTNSRRKREARRTYKGGGSIHRVHRVSEKAELERQREWRVVAINATGEWERKKKGSGQRKGEVVRDR
jgi:hypothetical protein